VYLAVFKVDPEYAHVYLAVFKFNPELLVFI
jgi:hypothetical protein